MKKIKICLSFFIIICLLFVMLGCKREIERREKVFFGCFDTVCTVYGYADESEVDFEENCEKIQADLQKYHRLFDIYNEYEGIVNLATVNKNAGGDFLTVDREIIELLLYAKELYTLTNGEMNIMMGSVLSLWHDCRIDASDGNVHLPDSDQLTEAANHTAINLLEIDEKNSAVRISDPHASIDVGAIAKGYATERTAEMLEKSGVNSYVLDVGGNIRIIGEKPDGDGWVTGIKSPFDDGEYVKRVNISDTSCVTSGNYERYFELDGERYHHIIDKDTLYPSKHFASVTVICRDSALADALSTALFCMSLEDGKALVEGLDGVCVLWVKNDGKTYMTKGFEELLEE